MQQVRDFGRYPKASKHVASRERRLAQNLREARKEKQLSPEQESELKVLQQAEMDSSNGEETEERRHLPEETNPTVTLGLLVMWTMVKQLLLPRLQMY